MTMAGDVRIVIVDDHSVFADALAYRLGQEEDLIVLETARSADVGLASVDLRRPDVAIIDVELGPENGLELVHAVRVRSVDTRVVVVTAHDDAETAVGAVRAGASALVAKDSRSELLVDVLRGVVRGESYVPPSLLTAVLQDLLSTADQRNEASRQLACLSDREEEILHLLVDGLDRAAIAARLFLSVNTVRTHIKNLFGKLEVHSSLEAVSLALQAGVRPRVTEEVCASAGREARFATGPAR